MPSSIIIEHDRRAVASECRKRESDISISYGRNAERCFSTTIPELFIIWPSE